MEQESLSDFGTLFQRQVRQTPQRTAILFEDQVATYAELDQLANGVAARLIKQGITPEECIGICQDRSLMAIASMIGILKAGCAFVPLDPAYPSERLRFMVDDAQLGCVISNAQYASLFPGLTILDAADFLRAGDQPSIANLDRPIADDALAYIMYTSGSTGKPKGVTIEHRALAAYCWADIDIYQLTEDDRTLQFSTLNFDIAIEEIFPPLLTGGTVVVRPRERPNAQIELSAIVEQYDATALHLATAYWHEWVDLMQATGCHVPKTIRLMVVTGEKVSAEHYRRWKALCNHDVLWCNAYGPTEATVTSTVFIPPAHWDGDNVPIGKPLKRYTAVILDDEKGRVAGDETGELYIGGLAVARNYHNRPELTQRAFVDWVDPQDPTQGPQRLYKTGDLARWLPDGNIEFAGRIDHQIKLGSYRIEPGEIEATINGCQGVRESLVTYDEVDGKKYLIAYVAYGDTAIDANHVAEYLRDQLPTFMIPTRYVLLPTFPITVNGKIDREALPTPSASCLISSSDYVAPRTEAERELAEVWADVLNVPRVGIHDDFFALGGSSLLVTRVIAQIADRVKQDIPVRDFFANPTVASIAQHLTAMSTQPGNTAVDGDATRTVRDRLPHLTPLYFASGTHSLFGVYYRHQCIDNRHAVVICPSIGHEYSRAYRNLQQLAIQLAQQGYHVLRFDYANTGNSSGAARDGRASQWREDVLTAVHHARTHTDAKWISLIGIRFGATICSQLSVDEVDSVIYWDPVLEGDAFCRQMDAFHTRMLGDLSRFPVRRQRSTIYQAFGMEMSPGKRTSISATCFDPSPYTSSSRHLVLLSQASPAPAAIDREGWRTVWTSDAIHWHDPSFTDRAFSSPQAFQEIQSFLQETRA